MDKQIIADLILGTYEHDLFKPFWLGNPKHAALGYAYQQTLHKQGSDGKDSTLRSAAVRFHTGLQSNEYLTSPTGQTLQQLPKALAAAHAIDQIASASYSLLMEESDGEESDVTTTEALPPPGTPPTAPGQSEQAAYKVLQDYWPMTVQNPFSRLPIYERAITKTRLVAGFTKKGGRSDPSDYVATTFGKAFLDAGKSLGVPHTSQAQIVRTLLPKMADLTPDQRLYLQTAHKIFSERTYPTANDTALSLHTCLAANLYHILLGNIKPGDHLDGYGLDTVTTLDTSGTLKLLSCHVITAHLTGLEERLNNAVRLDDLQGAKQLADRVRYAFKRQLCAKLGFDNPAAKASDGTTLADLLCISESRFEMTWLLPKRFVDDLPAQAAMRTTDEKLQTWLYEVYEAALCDVVKKGYEPPSQDGPTPGGQARMSLLELLRDDVSKDGIAALVAQRQHSLDVTEKALLEGLQPLLPAFGAVFVDAPAIVQDAQSRQQPLEESYGAALVQTYADARAQARQGGAPPIALTKLAEQMHKEDEWEEVCRNCQAAPAWLELSLLAFGRLVGTDQTVKPIELLQKFFHNSRIEDELLCHACVAQRALAHGITQEKALQRMVRGKRQSNETISLSFHDLCKADLDNSSPNQVQRDPSTNEAEIENHPVLRLPPLLHRRSSIAADPKLAALGDGGLVDLNALYIRPSGRAEDPLARFPSIAYAADSNSNVVLLTLHTNRDAIYTEQTFPPDFITQLRATDQTALDSLQARHDLYHYYFYAGYSPVTSEPNEAAQVEQGRALLSKIKPHLARVLQRQQTITAFFQMLPKRLQAAGVRVLTLEDQFPIGRFLVPADALTQALQVLDRSLCLDLLAVHGKDLGLDDHEVMGKAAVCDVLTNQRDNHALRTFLVEYVPNILVGTAMLFKQKQALYLMLRAEERLHHQIEAQSVLALGLVDMRGTVIDRGELHGCYSFANWGEMLDIVQTIDRPSLDSLAQGDDWLLQMQTQRPATLSPDARAEQDKAFTALLHARWVNRATAADVKTRVATRFWQLAEPCAHEQRRVAYFLARATRGG